MNEVRWHRASHASKPRNYRYSKLHLAVQIETGGYRALCRCDTILHDNPYPQLMFEKAKEDGRLCKKCLKLKGLHNEENKS